VLIDDYMPAYQYGERHAVAIEADRDRAYRAIKETTAAEMPLAGVLSSARGLPARLAGRRASGPAGSKPVLEELLSGGSVLLQEEPARELVVGEIGRFWSPTGNQALPVRDAQEFRAFVSPGYAKMALDFRLVDQGGGARTVVTTETRVFVPDPATRRKFGLYWLLIRPGSALIRKEWLQAIKRRAELSSRTPEPTVFLSRPTGGWCL